MASKGMVLGGKLSMAHLRFNIFEILVWPFVFEDFIAA